MIFCNELNKEFYNKREMFIALKENSSTIISLKKAQIYKSIDKGISVKCRAINLKKDNNSFKEYFKDDKLDSYYIAINTTKVLDSHGDLHVNGIWNRTAKNQNRKNYLVDSHEMSMLTTIVRKENVEILVKEMPFSLLGYNYEGTTEALIYKIPKDKIIMPLAKEWLESNDSIEASVRMQYSNIELAMNSDEKEDEVFKKNYDTFKSQIANKEDYEAENGDITHFWVVKEAKNIGEGSLVLKGSNSVTGQIRIDSLDNTQFNSEASEKSRLEEQKRNYYINKN